MLTYLLLPIGLFFGISAFSSILLAFANPQILLSVFMMGCFSIYIYCSFRFLQKIRSGEQITSKLKDWMRVNAYVCIFLSLILIVFVIAIGSLPAQKIEQLLQEAFDKMGDVYSDMSVEKYVQLMKGVSLFLLGLGILLLVHIFLNFQLQKQYPTDTK